MSKNELAEALAELKEERVLELVSRRVVAGEDPLIILEECQEGMKLVGERYERSEYFVSDLIMSAEIFKNAVALLEPKLATGRNLRMAGGHMCLMGDVPATLFKLGTPQQVEAHCKKLIDIVGKGGGFILSSGCEVPHDAKFENIKTMIDTAKMYQLSKN